MLGHTRCIYGAPKRFESGQLTMSGWNDGGRGDKGTKRMLQPGRDFFTGEDEVVLVGGENNNLTSVKLGVCEDHAHHALRLQEQQIEQNEARL